MKPKRYRIAWRDPATGKEGIGSWTFKDEAEKDVAYANKMRPDIEHYMEEEDDDKG